MKLNQQEMDGLTLAFEGSGQEGEALLRCLPLMTVISREFTGPGFYSSIELATALDRMPEQKLFEFNFTHPTMPNGGSFMCWLLTEQTLEIEAVTFGGIEWPKDIRFDQAMVV